MSYALVGSPEMLRELQNVTPESLVRFAGVTDEGKHENARLLSGQMGMVQQKPRHEQNLINYEAAAKYLPALVERFKQSEGPINPAMSLLNVLTYTPYFSRYVRQPDNGAEVLAQIQLTRIVQAKAELSSYSADEIAEVGQFLSTLLAVNPANCMKEEDIKTMTPVFKSWMRTFRGRLAGEVGDRCITMLSNNSESQMMRMMMKQQLGSCLEKCGGPGCRATTRGDGAELLQCAKCKIAVYCGTEHQKAAWKTHKTDCFQSSF